MGGFTFSLAVKVGLLLELPMNNRCCDDVTLLSVLIQGTHVTVWLQHTDRVSHVLLSPDGTAIGSSSWDGTLKVLLCCCVVDIVCYCYLKFPPPPR